MPGKTIISEIMTKDLFTVQIDDKVLLADEIMKNQKVKHDPVLEGKKLVGIISDRGLKEYTLKQLYSFEDPLPASARNRIIDFQSIMDKDIRVIYPEDGVLKAVEIMLKKKAGCLPVVDWSKNLVGMLTHTDVLLYLHRKLIELTGTDR
jgi:predicted transcriptional regulator